MTTVAAAKLDPLALVRLAGLMARTGGRPEVLVGLIDGPVALGHPELVPERIRVLPEGTAPECSSGRDTACDHGTFVAGILTGRRGPTCLAICPDCTILSRPIFAAAGGLPVATADELAAAIIETVQAGARVVNLSLAVGPAASPSVVLAEALDWAVSRGVLLVAAAGNSGTLAGSQLTRHPGVIPVAGCDRRGRPTAESNLTGSIGRNGLLAPGEAVTSLSPGGRPVTSGGTSAAVPFVAGTAALLLSAFPGRPVAVVRSALTDPAGRRRRSIVPPLLDAAASFDALSR